MFIFCYVLRICVDSKLLSQTVCFCHSQSMSVRDTLCLSQTVCFCQRHFVFVTDSQCPSQNVCFCQSQSVSVTKTLPWCFWPTSWPKYIVWDICPNIRPRYLSLSVIALTLLKPNLAAPYLIFSLNFFCYLGHLYTFSPNRLLGRLCL